jgi:hypothetical protein
MQQTITETTVSQKISAYQLQNEDENQTKPKLMKRNSFTKTVAEETPLKEIMESLNENTAWI